MRSRGTVALLLVVAAVGVGGGAWLGRATRNADTVTLQTTTVTTRTVTVASTASGAESALPPPVADTRAKLLAAATARDWAAVGRLAGARLSYTFGDASSGPVAFWQREEANGGKPLETLAALLRMPYVLAGDTYVWPFAYAEDPAKLTPYEKRLLAPVASAEDVRSWVGYGSYIGYRLGIAPDGTWRFFVRGD